jgi:hypothetical protein
VESLNFVYGVSVVTWTALDEAVFIFLGLGVDSSRFARRNDFIAWDRTTWEYVAVADSGRSVTVINSSCKGSATASGWFEPSTTPGSPQPCGLPCQVSIKPIQCRV